MSISLAPAKSTEKSAPDYLSFSRAHGSIDALDGLRTIAIVLVLFRHAMRGFESVHGDVLALSTPLGNWSLATPMLNGWMGVDLFFVLSGFLIGGHLIRRRHSFSRTTLTSYFGARALRIVPTYIAVLGLVALGAFPFFTIESQNIGLSLVWHVLFLQDYLPSDLIVAFWSLGVEEKFYIIAPLLVLGCGKLTSINARILLLLVLIFLPLILRAITLGGLDTELDYKAYFETFRSPFHLTFDGLMIGVLCAEIYHHEGLKTQFSRHSNALLAFGTSIIALHLLPVNLMANITLYDILLQPLLISTGFGAILLATALRNSRTGILASKFSLIGARLSYAMYLVHMALIPLALGLAMVSGLSGAPLFMLFFALFLTLSTGVSMLLHFAVEKPFLQLKSRWFN